MNAESNAEKKRTGAARHWLWRVLTPFTGSARGSGFVEYILIGALCALGLTIGFQRFRAKGNITVRNEAKVVASFDAPNPADVIAALGGFEDYQEKYNCNGDICTLPGQCFGAGTLVATEFGDRPIESIQLGERVWSRNEKTLAVDLHPVTERFVTENRYVVDLQLGHDLLHSETLRVTPNHPFWVEGKGWTDAEELSGATLWSPDGSVSASGLVGWNTTQTVYNLEVEGDHTYFVGLSHALVHNATKPPKAKCPGTPTYTPREWGMLGEQRGSQQAAIDGLSEVLDDWSYVNPIRRSSVDDIGLSGFDDVRQDRNGNIYIVEYKGNTAKLNTKYPPQMSGAWVDAKLGEISKWLGTAANLTDASYAKVEAVYKEILDAKLSDKLFGRVYSTPADPNAKSGVGGTQATKGFDYKTGNEFDCGRGSPNPPCP